MIAPHEQGGDIIVAHASDLHIDDDYTAKLHGGDGTAGLGAVLAAADRAGAHLLILAGDTFDSHRQADAVIERVAGRLRDADLPVVVLPGNHDPAVDGAVYQRPALAALDRLAVLGITHQQVVGLPELELDVWGNAHRDYFDMDPLAGPHPRSARWHIAAAHGHYEPVPDRSVLARPSWLFGDDEISATDADYVALGHWNRRLSVGSATIPAWYSGSPEYTRSINVVRLSANGSVTVGHAALDFPAGFGEGIL